MQSSTMGSHLDPQLEDRILHEVKSQGVFDEFRKDSMADVDTKPAYQNLRQRVENTVKKFLSEQHWTPDMNKNQLRERLRRHISESGFLDVGVERIVDQVVNPKIGTVFQPRIEEITYKYLGLPPPPTKHEPPPPIMHPLPPLPLSGPPPLKIETSSLLPTGLEQVSPDSDKATVKSECREDDKSIMDMDVDADEKLAEDDDESPPFEPLVKCVENSKTIKAELVKNSEEVVDMKSPTYDIKIEPMLDEKTGEEPFGNVELKDPERKDPSSINIDTLKNPTSSFEADAGISQYSQLSAVSSDSRISDVTANASHSFTDTSNTHNPPQTHSDQIEVVMELATANISEEAQMPKFNENSCEMATAKEPASDLHFDIKKDGIKFEGTERKSSRLQQEGDGSSVIVDEALPRQVATPSVNLENKEPPHHFGNLTIDTILEHKNQTTDPTTPTATPTPTPHDSSFGSSLEDLNYQPYTEQYEDRLKNESTTAVESALTNIVQGQIDKKELSSSQNRGSSSSSSRHKKHSKDKRRSHDPKEKYGSKEKSKKRDRSRDKDRGEKDRSHKSKHRDKERSTDKHRERSEKHRSKSSHKNKERSSKHNKHNKSKNDSLERSSSSKRSSSSTARSHDTSSSKHEKNSTPSSSSSSRSDGHEARREKRQSDGKSHRRTSKNRSSSKKDDNKSGTPKNEILVDDHNSEKVKDQRRKSTDSNDEGKSGGGHNDGSQRVCEILNYYQGSCDKQQSQQKETNGTSPSSQSPKGKSKGFADKRTEDSNITIETCNAGSANKIIEKTHRNMVFILNDMLENPNINFIDLGPSVTTYSVSSSTPTADIALPKIADTPSKIAETALEIENTPPKINMSPQLSEKISPATSRNSMLSPKNEKEQLLFFDETNAQFCNRLRLLDNAMDRCRRVVNNLRFDCANELCDAFEEQQSTSEPAAKVTAQTCATLRIDCVPAYAINDCCGSSEKSGNSPVGNSVYENVYELHGKRKRANNGESKPSPTPSDASGNSKENMALDKNDDMVKCVRRNASLNKLNQQQRYNSEDLYKPRPVLSQRSRRRGMDALI
ncbi:PREDICTED: biorientation of chromosomes in cell division protein 1-like 1 isoform X1 [Rhagoletis zephyria]|uniref:biorientation of chromosomes in cell division protein 1-like 1 isoform X1 n=1 Tax=Rhagoletis zephyria TaxID=28612 RepID=UPI0008116F50|nr:PREDICTED: biorientation of chromosomes in cell division protein 1-like 1 isoform X1 [Rhagoletis zephyria]